MCASIVGQDDRILQPLQKMLEINPSDRPDFLELKFPSESPVKSKSEYNLILDKKSI
jgi:hypothetical protein